MTVTTKAPPAQRRMAKPSSIQLRLDTIEQRLERLEAALDTLVAAVSAHLAPHAEDPAPQPAPLGDPPPEPVFGVLSNAEGFRFSGDGKNLHP